MGKIIDIGKEKFNLYAVSDLHYEHKNSNHKAFKYVVEQIKNDSSAKVILLGDLFDMSVRASVRDESDVTMDVSSALYEVTELLRPIKDKIVGIVSGNHERKTAKRYLNWHIETTICNMLGLPPSTYKPEEDIYTLGLSVFRLKKKSRTALYKVFYTHGTRGGTIGNVLNQTVKYNGIERLDLKIVGHFHEFGLTIQGINYVALNGEIKTKTQTSVCLSSFLPTSNFLITKMKNVSIPVLAKFEIEFIRQHNGTAPEGYTSDYVKTTPYIETLERFI